jgi:hypothetical protein
MGVSLPDHGRHRGVEWEFIISRFSRVLHFVFRLLRLRLSGLQGRSWSRKSANSALAWEQLLSVSVMSAMAATRGTGSPNTAL